MMFKRKHCEVEGIYLSNKRCKTLLEDKTRCKFCPRVFVDKNNYLKHLKKSHDRAFNCKYCSYTTRYKLNIPKHMVTHGIILKWFKCRYCDRQFKRNSARSYHEVSHIGVSCKICNEKFYSPCTILSHIGAQHPEENKFYCDICGKSYPTNVMRNSHLRNSNCRNGYKARNEKDESSNSIRNRKIYLFYCDLCSKGFNKENSLLAHKFMRLCRNSKISDLQFSWTKHFVTDCKLCGQSIISRVHLKRHLLSKHRDAFYIGKSSLSEECPFCGKIIKDKIGRFMHIIRHLGFIPLKCHICDFRTSWTVSLKMHLVKIHGNKYFMCHLCNRTCANSSEYKEHLDNEHNIVQEFKYLCDDCGMGFYYLKTFRNHKNKCPFLVHENKDETIVKLQCEYCQNDENCNSPSEIHECVFCGFIFETCLEIKQHKILFAYDRLCSFCSYIAVHGCYLSCHLKEVHPSYCIECDICCIRFSNSVTYCRHLRSHGHRNKSDDILKKSNYYKPTYDSEEEDLFSVKRLQTDVLKVDEFFLIFECCICGMYFPSAKQSLEHERMHKGVFNLTDDKERFNKYLFNEFYANFVMQKVAEVKVKVISSSVPLSNSEYSVKKTSISKPGSNLITGDYNQLSKARRKYIFKEPPSLDNKLEKNVNGHIYHKNLLVKCEHNPTQFDIKLIKITKKVKNIVKPNLNCESKFITSLYSSLGISKLTKPQTASVTTIPAHNNSEYRILEKNCSVFSESQLLKSGLEMKVQNKVASNVKNIMPVTEEVSQKPVQRQENDFQHSNNKKNCNEVIDAYANSLVDKNIFPTFKEGNYNYAIRNEQVNFNDMKPINLNASKKLKYVGTINLPKSISMKCKQEICLNNESPCDVRSEYTSLENSPGERVMKKKTILLNGRNHAHRQENDFQHSNNKKKCNKVIDKYANSLVNKNIFPTFKEGNYNYALRNEQVNFNDMKPINLNASKKLKYVGTINLPKSISMKCKQEICPNNESPCDIESEFISIENSLGERVMKKKTILVNGRKRVILEDCGMAKKLLK